MPGWLDTLLQQVLFDWFWNAIWFWRVLSLALLGAMGLAWINRDRLQEWLWPRGRINHDRERFEEIDALLPEGFVEGTVEHVGATAGAQGDRLHRIDRAIAWLNRHENRFLTEAIQESAEELRTSFMELRRFTASHFFPQPKDSDLYQLEPELNIDTASNIQRAIEETDRYDAYYHELNDLLDDVEEAYSDFRNEVKDRLHV